MYCTEVNTPNLGSHASSKTIINAERIETEAHVVGTIHEQRIDGPNANAEPLGEHGKETRSVTIPTSDQDLTRKALDSWKLRLVSKAPRTQEYYIRHVERLIEISGGKPANRLTDDHIQLYLNSLKGYSNKALALAAIKSFLKSMGRVIRYVDIGKPGERRPIDPLTSEEFGRMLSLTRNALERALLLVLYDTGGRISGVLSARLIDWQGGQLVLTGEFAKNKITSTSPLTQDTQIALQRHVTTNHPQEYLFETNGKKMDRRIAWRIINRLGKRARITKRCYPHLFRHMAGLRFSGAHAQSDTILNTMGWANLNQFNTRYGKRDVTKTLPEARAILEHDQAPQITTQQIDAETLAKALVIAELIKKGKLELSQ